MDAFATSTLMEMMAAGGCAAEEVIQINRKSNYCQLLNFRFFFSRVQHNQDPDQGALQVQIPLVLLRRMRDLYEKCRTDRV